MEKVLTSHPDVEEAYAIGVKDYKYGEIVGTFVRRKEGSTLTAEELRAFCVGKTPTLSIPSYYWFVDEFPASQQRWGFQTGTEKDRGSYEGGYAENRGSEEKVILSVKEND